MKITQVISFASNKFGNRVKVYTQFESVIDYNKYYCWICSVANRGIVIIIVTIVSRR